ncbi:MAG: putative LytR family transcriptional protein [Candidatus Berkelbacteria bacterium]|nr:putative LytR family transcriptional protein [Candidatus Berkelbacteria bacterium]
MRNKVQPVPPPTQPRVISISGSPWKKRLKWAILAIILVVVGIGVWVGFSANRALQKITDDSGNKSSLFSLLGDVTSTNIKGQSQGRTNILILGKGNQNHPGGALTDTMIVLSINYNDKKISMISIPRDLWVPIQGYGHAKINEAYSDGEKSTKTKNSSGGGGQLSSRTVENVLGVPIHYYITLDFDGFKKIVDTVGGVDVYVEKDLYDPYYPAPNMIDYEPLRISVGPHHLDGTTALKYARSRETTSDFDRSRRQMQVMMGIREKFFTLQILASPKKITDLINILGDHIRTNMQVSEIRALWDISKNLDTTNIINKVFDTTAGGPLVAGQDSRGYYIYPRKGIDNFSELQNIAKNIFSLQADNIAEAKIEVSNGSGKTGLASSVANYLESYGYSVTKVTTATSKVQKTIVYDYSGGKYKEVADKIASLLKASVQQGTNVRQDVNIQVLMGQDYLSNQ